MKTEKFRIITPADFVLWLVRTYFLVQNWCLLAVSSYGRRMREISEIFADSFSNLSLAFLFSQQLFWKKNFYHCEVQVIDIFFYISGLCVIFKKFLPKIGSQRYYPTLSFRNFMLAILYLYLWCILSKCLYMVDVRIKVVYYCYYYCFAYAYLGVFFSVFVEKTIFPLNYL